MSALAVLICVNLAAYWAGRQFGYRDGIRDGVEMEREAWCGFDDDDDGGPDGDGEPLPLPTPKLTVVRDRGAA